MSISRCRELKSNGGCSMDMVQEGLALGERGLGSRDKWTLLYVADCGRTDCSCPGELCSICSLVNIALMDQARHSPARFHSPNPKIVQMASVFLTPPPTVLADDYDGLEYKWKFFVFRPAGMYVFIPVDTTSAQHLSVLQVQAFLLLALLVYVAFSLYGKAVNERKAAAFCAAVLPLFTRQFSQPSSPSGLVSDGLSDFFVFSTGRRAIASLHTVLTLLPRHDPLQLIWQYAWSAYDLRYEPFDVLTFDFTLDAEATAAIPDCIWAVVRKSELTTIRNSRWDLVCIRLHHFSPLLLTSHNRRLHVPVTIPRLVLHSPFCPSLQM